jgi:hypothetical protein
MTREETLERLAESRQALHQAIQGLGEEEMTQVQVEGVWTIKDVPLRRYADGSPFEVEVIEDYLAWNDEQAACKRDVPLDVIQGELSTVRQGLVGAARRLSAGQWEQRVPYAWGGEGTVAEALDGLCVHELEHVRAIQQWRSSSH